MVLPSSATSSTTNLALPLAETLSRQHSGLSITDNVGVRSRNKKSRNTEESQVTRSDTGTPSCTRSVSPINPKLCSPHTERRRRSPIRKETFAEENQRSKTNAAKKSVWDGSWATQGLNALQEMAFSMMAGDSHSDGHRPRRPALSQRRGGWLATATNKGKSPSNWGPDTNSTTQKDARIGIGDLFEREDKDKERKKARMLEGLDSVANSIDSAGNYKCRTSVEEDRKNGQEDDDNILVYLYHVQPDDTLQGVVLKFHSKMDVFKKANRLWAGDSIQVRKKVYLPVNACAIKGRPCPTPPDVPMEGDLTGQSAEREEPPFSIIDKWPNEISTEFPSDDETPWTHICWVTLDSLPSTPVEIIRVSRKTLNYFPPRRRRSFTTISAFSTPRMSSDLPGLSRSSIDSQTSTTSRKTSATGYRPSQFNSNSFNSLPSPDSLSNSLDRLGWLRGPGGVGTLGKNVRKPGPAKDALNTWTSKRFPSIAIDSLPSTSTISIENAQIHLNDGEIENIAPEDTVSTLSRPSSSSLSFPTLNLNSVEGWVRKIATKVQMPGTPKEDAIEMLDGAGSSDGRGFELVTGASFIDGGVERRRRRNDIENSARERGKSGKSE